MCGCVTLFCLLSRMFFHFVPAFHLFFLPASGNYVWTEMFEKCRASVQLIIHGSLMTDTNFGQKPNKRMTNVRYVSFAKRASILAIWGRQPSQVMLREKSTSNMRRLWEMVYQSRHFSTQKSQRDQQVDQGLPEHGCSSYASILNATATSAAETLWAHKVVDSHYLYNSCSDFGGAYFRRCSQTVRWLDGLHMEAPKLPISTRQISPVCTDIETNCIWVTEPLLTLFWSHW